MRYCGCNGSEDILLFHLLSQVCQMGYNVLWQKLPKPTLLNSSYGINGLEFEDCVAEAFEKRGYIVPRRKNHCGALAANPNICARKP